MLGGFVETRDVLRRVRHRVPLGPLLVALRVLVRPLAQRCRHETKVYSFKRRRLISNNQGTGALFHPLTFVFL